MSGPIDSRRKTYWPPARGNIAASSPYESAPSSVITPVATQAKRSQNGEPSVRDMLADTIKIPEPIIEPATSIVASGRVIALTNSGFGCCAGTIDPEAVFGAATLVIQLLVRAGDQALPKEGCRKPVKNRPCAGEALLATRLHNASGRELKIPADLRLHPNRRSVGPRSRPKTHALEYISKALVVVSVPRGREIEA